MRLEKGDPTVSMGVYATALWLLTLALFRYSSLAALVAAGLLTQRELDTAIRDSETHRRPVETLLMERHKLRRQEVGAALSLFYQCPFKEYDERLLPVWDSVREINPNYLKANLWIPLQVTEESVEILIDDPRAYDKIRDVKRLFPGKEIKCAVGLR